MGKKKTQTTPNELKLTEKQEKFCQFYLDTDGNASEAYRMAYDASNMQPATIWSAASAMLAKHKVSIRIEQIKAERAQASKIEREKVEKVLMDIITASPGDLYTVDPVSGKIKMKSPHQLPKRMRNALRKIRNNRGVVEYEFNNKVDAARLLGAWNGWDAPKEVNVNNRGSMSGELRIGFGDDDE